MFEQIDIHQVKEMLSIRPLVVDIRDEDSFQESHIPTAIRISDANDAQKLIASADKTVPLICYCYHGISSCQAAEYFSQNGFIKVYSMKGGFEEWRTVYVQGK